MGDSNTVALEEPLSVFDVLSQNEGGEPGTIPSNLAILVLRRSVSSYYIEHEQDNDSSCIDTG